MRRYMRAINCSDKMDLENAYKVVVSGLKNPQAWVKEYRRLVDDAASFQGVFVMQEYYWLAERIKSNTTVLDIGAKNGDTSIYFAMFPNTKWVIAYEPAPMNQMRFAENIRKNPFKAKINLCKKAIDSKRWQKRVSNSAYGQGYSFTNDKKVDGEWIKAITLNDALRGLKNVAIKCDCEGAEERIFNDVDMRNVYIVMLEWHDEHKRKCARESLIAQGFKIVKDYRGSSCIICAKR